MKSDELHSFIANMKVGDAIASSELPGCLEEIHRAPGGWIYVFGRLTSGSMVLHTQFVPRGMLE